MSDTTINSTAGTNLLDDRYRVGTLTYTKLGIASLFGWMVMANLSFNLFEGQGGAGSIPFYLQENFRISNTMVNILFNFIPMIIGTFMTPVVSFWSDRTRTRLGRRIPYILYTAPFLVLFAIGLGFSDDIIKICKVRFATNAALPPMTVALIIIGFLTIGWAFFNEFVGTVFYYLIPDVTPRHFLGRFQGVTSMAGQLLNIAMNTWVNPHQLTHIKHIHAGVAILYFISFSLVCWRVKEGQYPPVEDEPDRSEAQSETARIKTRSGILRGFLIGLIAGALAFGTMTALWFGFHIGWLPFRAFGAGPFIPQAFWNLPGSGLSQTIGEILGCGALGAFVGYISTRDRVQLYFRECFFHPMYIMVYTVAAVTMLTRGLAVAPSFQLHISQHQASVAAPGGGASVVALAPDGKLFAAGGRDGVIQIFDNSSMKKPYVLRTLPGNGAAINALLLSPDGKTIVCGYPDGAIRVWDASGGAKTPMQSLAGHSAEIRSLAISPDGSLLASASADKTVKIWDMASGACLQTLTGHSDVVNSVAFSSTGQLVVSGSSDKSIIIWDAKAGTIVKKLQGSPGPVYAVCFAPELAPPPVDPGASGVGAMLHSTLDYLKNVFLNETLYDPPPDRSSRIVGQDRWVVSGGRDGKTDEENSGVRIWDVDKGALIPAIEDLKTKAMKGHKRAVTAVAYKPDLRVIVSGSSDRSMRIWKPLDMTDTVTKVAEDQAFRSYAGYTHAVTSVAVQNAGVRLVNASEDGTLHTWDMDQGISLNKGSRYKGNFFAILTFLLAFPIGMLVDRWNPIKVVLWTTFLGLPLTLVYFFWFHDYMSIIWIDLAMMPVGMLGGMAATPMMVMIYPKTKYGQFCSANAMVRQAIGAFAGILGALLMDWITSNTYDTDNYRYAYLLRFSINTVSFLCLLGVYVYWKRLGGEKGYVAPEAEVKTLTDTTEAEAAAAT